MGYKILALDGGGSWAIIQAMALKELFGPNTTGHEVLSKFDLVAANSGGSIVLGTLIENCTMSEIFDFFNSQPMRESVFVKSDSLENSILHAIAGVGPKYSAEHKLAGLRTALPRTGDVPLPDAASAIKSSATGEPVHVLITSFDYDRNRAMFFRSSLTEAPGWGTGDETGVTVAEAIHASTNAPVNYFDKPATFSSGTGRYWDGGIAGCNNPVLAAVAEAIGKRQDPTTIVALSLGTASVVRPCQTPGQALSAFLSPRTNPGIITDLKKLAGAIVDDPPDVATFLAHLMTGSGLNLNTPLANTRIIRMNPLVTPAQNNGQLGPPAGMTPTAFSQLANLDFDAVDQNDVNSITDYAAKWLADEVPNQPVRMDSGTFRCEIGQKTFSAAKAAWNAISS